MHFNEKWVILPVTTDCMFFYQLTRLIFQTQCNSRNIKSKREVDSGFNHNRNVKTEDKYWLKLNQLYQ